MQLYNSLTGRPEAFRPLGDPVTIYVCGITPYDTTHLGHAFTYTANDILIRYLEYRGRKVRYVQNVTDVDDDILGRAEELGEDWRALGNRWTTHFIEDMRALNVRPPEAFPRASEVIEGIIRTVEGLLEAGVAYEVEGNVYFDIEAWDEFGKLSKLSSPEMLSLANERGNDPGDPNKRDPLHFVLWQAAKVGEPSWESPWGRGRPGWHIECSTMATELLAEQIDIHSGGADLLFPHHECEIAQVEPITGRKPFVRWWVHTAMVHHQGQKMSKSLGNLVMVRDLLARWSPDALRLYLGCHHYRTPWEHDPDELAAAADLADQLEAANACEPGQGPPLEAGDAVETFERAMENDLDSGNAVAALESLAESILGARGRSVAGAQETLRSLSAVFGLRLGVGAPEARVVQGWRDHLARFEVKDSG